MLARRTPNVLAHWSLLVEDYSTSAMDFYAAVEEAVKRRQPPEVVFSRVARREGGIESAKREYLRVQRGRYAFDLCAAPFGNGYFFSSWLAVIPNGSAVGLIFRLLFWMLLLSGATYFVANHLEKLHYLFFIPVLLLIGIPVLFLLLGLAVQQDYLGDEDAVLATPILGWLYNKIFNPMAYFRFDSALMFRKTVHEAVLEVVDGLHKEHGMRALAPGERSATVRDFTE